MAVKSGTNIGVGSRSGCRHHQSSLSLAMTLLPTGWPWPGILSGPSHAGHYLRIFVEKVLLGVELQIPWRAVGRIYIGRIYIGRIYIGNHQPIIGRIISSPSIINHQA